jgi:hypothetical protein
VLREAATAASSPSERRMSRPLPGLGAVGHDEGRPAVDRLRDRVGRRIRLVVGDPERRGKDHRQAVVPRRVGKSDPGDSAPERVTELAGHVGYEPGLPDTAEPAQNDRPVAPVGQVGNELPQSASRPINARSCSGGGGAAGQGTASVGGIETDTHGRIRGRRPAPVCSRQPSGASSSRAYGGKRKRISRVRTPPWPRCDTVLSVGGSPVRRRGSSRSAAVAFE